VVLPGKRRLSLAATPDQARKISRERSAIDDHRYRFLARSVSTMCSA
jgi:hypothetical protein